MLHGYTQNGHFFSIKTRPLTRTLTKTLSQTYNVPEDSIEFIYPDGILQLRSPDTSDDASHNIKESSTDMRAWWHNLDGVNPYIHIEETLASLAVLAHTRGPFTGVIGFSQGATLAAMFTAWCESGSVPGRHESMQAMAKAKQNALLLEILSQPPQQRPLDFAVYCSGYRGTPEYYWGFYEPRIGTPTVHVHGRWDTLIFNPLFLSLAEGHMIC